MVAEIFMFRVNHVFEKVYSVKCGWECASPFLPVRLEPYSSKCFCSPTERNFIYLLSLIMKAMNVDYKII